MEVNKIKWNEVSDKVDETVAVGTHILKTNGEWGISEDN